MAGYHGNSDQPNGQNEGKWGLACYMLCDSNLKITAWKFLYQIK